MLRLEARGTTHPKTFVLITNDSEGELAAINDTLSEGDVMSVWFNRFTAAQFDLGVEVPADMVGEFQEVLEVAGMWEAAEVIETERENTVAAEMEEDEDEEDEDDEEG